MKTDDYRLWDYLKSYFTLYLPKQRNSSKHTITAAKDTWNLLLRYLSKTKGMPLDCLTFNDITASVVTDFLDHMTDTRKWKPATRNQRLSFIRSFFDFASCKEPTLYVYAAPLKSIPQKRNIETKVLEYMSREAMRTLLAAPDASSPKGLRDTFFMSLMYDTAARDCEMLSMDFSSYNDESLTVCLMGKGAKPRVVPVSKETTEIFKRYSSAFHHDKTGQAPMFYTVRNGQKMRMSDDNVARFIKKHAAVARETNPEIPTNVHPHMFRKSRAMHLYQGGMDLSMLSQFLGHEDPQTTLIYARADIEMKQAAIEKAMQGNNAVASINSKPIWEGDGDLIGRLCRGY